MSANEEYLDSLLKSVTGSEDASDFEETTAEEKPEDIFPGGEETGADISEDFVDDLHSLPAEDEDTQLDIDAMLSELTNGTFDLDYMEKGSEEEISQEKVRSGAVTLDETQNMSEADIDDLLTASMAFETSQDIGLPEEEDDIVGMTEADDDEDLQAISSLLRKSENNEVVDEDVLALLESVSGENTSGNEPFDIFSGEAEEIQDEGKKKKKEKRPKKEKRSRKKVKPEENNQPEPENTTAEDENLISGNKNTDIENQQIQNREIKKDKKPGFFSKLFTLLTEEEETENDPKELSPADENAAIMKELDAEDRAEAKKKKGKKTQKGSKGKAAASGEEDEDGKAKPKKEKTKKPAKPKKEKRPKEAEEEQSSKKLAKASVFIIILLAFSVFVCILLSGTIINSIIYRNNAKKAFNDKNYEEAYELLAGMDVNKEEETMLHHARAILTIERRLESYEQYLKLDKKLEALDSLMQAVAGYDELYQYALNYGADLEVAAVYSQILTVLSEKYGLNEAEARTIAFLESDVEYTRSLTNLVEGRTPGIMQSGGAGEPVQGSGESLPDMLPEEMELPDAEFSN